MIDLNRDEAKKNCFEKIKFKMADSKKTEIFNSANSQYFFVKISEIGFWVNRINWCEGHQCYSTDMVVRLSDIRPKTGKTHKKCTSTNTYSPFIFSNHFWICMTSILFLRLISILVQTMNEVFQLLNSLELNHRVYIL